MKQKVIYLFLALVMGLAVLAPNTTFAQQDQGMSDTERELIQLIEEGNTEQATQILEEMDPPNQEPPDEEIQAAQDEDVMVVGLEASGSDLQVALAWNPQKDRPQSAQLAIQDHEGKAVAEVGVETQIREQAPPDEDAPMDEPPQPTDVSVMRVTDALKDVDSKGLRYEIIITDDAGKELTRYPYHVMIVCEDEENCSYEVFGGISTEAILISEELDRALDAAEREEPEDILATVLERHPDLTGDVYALSLQLAAINGTDETDSVRARCLCWWTAVVNRTPATASFFSTPAPVGSVFKAGWEGPGAAHYFAAKSVGGSTGHWTVGSTKLTMKMRCWGIVGWTVKIIVIHFPWGTVTIKIYIPIFGYCPPQCDGKVEQSVRYLGHTTADTAGTAYAAAYDRASYQVNGSTAAGFPVTTFSWATPPGNSDADFGFGSASVSTAQPSTAELNTLGAVGVWAEPSSSACAKVVNGFIMSATATASCTIPNTVTASMLGAHPSHTRYLWWDLQYNVLDRRVCERELQPPGDLGDAPDSSNHFNVKMSAYPGVAARYPTVFDVTSPDVPGPLHWDAHGDAWLGKDVTLEKDADQAPDEDPTTNLIPVNDQANLDKADDGVHLDTVSIPSCGRTRFDYDVNVVGPNQRRFVNVWFDYNRDGDWEDVLRCETANGTVIQVPEWSVQQHVIAVGPGYHTLTTPAFAAMRTPSQDDPMWMRITLSDGPAPTARHDFEVDPIDDIAIVDTVEPVDTVVAVPPMIAASRPLTIAPPLLFRADGRGPDGGYEYGETEDYFLNRNPLPGEICGKKWDDQNGNGIQDAGEPGIPGWTIHVYDTAGNLIGTTTTLIGGGEYCFTLPPGTYVVGEALQPGWVQTFPAPPGTHTVNLGANQSIVNKDFGNQRRDVQECVVPPRGMRAWWTLDETGGMIAGDIAGFPNDGIHMNGPTFSPGMVAGALTFDGINDHIKVNDHPELNFGTSDFTIDAWIRTDNADGFRPIVDKRNPGPSDLPFGYTFYLQDGLLGFRINTDIVTGSGTSAGDTSSGPNLADGEWHFVAVTVERGSTTGGKLYVDGALIHTFDMTPLIGDADNNSPLIIASRNRFFGPPVDNFFDGQLDEIEIFHRDLTAAEIQGIYQAGRLGKCKDEIAGGSVEGTKWHDTNGNGVRDREEGLRGWTIIITNEAGTSYSTTTDAEGNYSFTNLPAGNYTITEVIQPGWTQTFPKKGVHKVELEAGQALEGFDFGNWRENDGSCHVGWDIDVFNTDSNTIEVGMNINNQSTVDANYQLNIVGSPTMIVHGFTATTPFDPGQPLPTPPVFVPANESVYVALFMSPLPTILGPSGQYQVIVTDPATGRSFGCSAQLWQNDDVGVRPLNDILIAELEPNEPQEIFFEVHNLGNEPLDVELRAEQMFGLPGQELDVLRFEMLAPPLLPLEPGDIFEVPILVELIEPVPGGIGDIILFADINGDQRPDTAASVIIKAADDTPPSVCISHRGLRHCPVEGARLSSNGEEIKVGNPGADGEFGVAIHVGQSDYILTTLTDLQAQEPSSESGVLSFHSVGELNGVPGQPISALFMESVSDGRMAISANMENLGVENPIVEIYDENGEVVGRSDVNRITVQVPQAMDCTIDATWPMPDTVVSVIEMPEPVEIILADGTAVKGSEIHFVGKTEQQIGSITQLDVIADDFASFTLKDTRPMFDEPMCVDFSDLQHCPVGEAKLIDSDAGLIVSNIGSSGQDGVSIDIGDATRWDVEIPDFDSRNLPPGASLELTQFGMVDGRPDTRIGGLRLISEEDDLMEVIADYSGVDVESFTVQAIQDGEVIREFTGHPGTDIFARASFIYFYWILIVDGNGNFYFEWCLYFSLAANPGSVNINNEDIQLDTLMIRTETPLADIGPESQMILRAADVEQFTILSEKAATGEMNTTNNAQVAVVLGDTDSATMQVMEGHRIEIPVSVEEIPAGVAVGAATLEVDYNATQLKPVSCVKHPDDDFASVLCNLDFAPGVVRLNGTSKVGITDSGNMALIEWEAVGSAGDNSELMVDIKTLADVDAAALNATVHSQKIEIVDAPRPGDVGCDGGVDSTDALLILQLDVGMRNGADQCLQSARQERTVYLPACDLNNDGVCGSVDALLILQCDVGIPNQFCPEDGIVTGRSEPEAATNSTLRLDHPEIVVGDEFTMMVMTEADVKLGAATVELNYDPSQFKVIACERGQDERFTGGQCNPTFEGNIVRFNVVISEGASGPLHLADINFKHIGDMVDVSGFSLTPTTYADVNSEPAEVTFVEISDISTTGGDEFKIYLPTIQN